jgi:putative ABC transport system ATP-binding protein
MKESQSAMREPHVELVSSAAVSISKVSKSFRRENEDITVLDAVDLHTRVGSFEALMGPSGSGKTTLLNLIAGLDRPTSGNVVVAGKNLSGLSNSELSRWRAEYVGIVFQAHNLLPVLTAVENVMLPLALRRIPRGERRKRAETALRLVGLENRLNHYPRQLSGGQEQRVAIARAIVHDPALILADEPTGDLDRQRADEILTLLEKLNKEFNKTILMVTHDPAAADRTQLVRRIDKGRLV